MDGGVIARASFLPFFNEPPDAIFGLPIAP